MSMGTIITNGLKTKTLLNRAIYPNPMTSGMYIMIDGSNCPTDYTEDTAFDTRYPLGASTDIGTTAGSNTYSHTHSWPTWKHSEGTGITFNNTTTNATAVTWYPPYVKVKFCRKN